jgi:PAS domain S-box-containing protein
MSILPVITLAMVWTNNFHHLMWTSVSLDTGISPPVDIAIQGAYWWVHAVYSYSLIGIGIVLLFNYYFKVTGIYRKQVSVMLIGAFVPLVANFIYIAKIHLPFEIDPTPTAFTITGIAFFWGLSRVQLFSIMPIAYDTIFKSMNDGVIIVDPFNRIIEANPAASNMLNSKSILVTGTNINRLFSEVVCSTALKTETVPAQLEIEISKETTSRYYDLYISSIFNQNLLKGRILLLHEFTEKRNVAIISRERSLLEQELIERKKVETALRISEQFNLSVMEYSPNPLFIIDSDGSIKYINPAFEKLSGYSKSEAIGIKRPFPWWPLEERQRFIDASANLPVPNGLFNGERMLNNKSGVQFLVEQHSTHIAGNDGTPYLLATWVDITTRKQNENALAISKEKLQTLTEDAPIMICNVDLEGNIKYVNKMFEKVTRLKRSEVVGSNGFKISNRSVKQVCLNPADESW